MLNDSLFFVFSIADGLDVSHVQLTDATFYEKVHPSVNELEYSYEGNENRFGIKLGQVKFGLEYDFEREELRVTIFEAKNLPAADEGTTIAFKLCLSSNLKLFKIHLDITHSPNFPFVF